MRWAVVLVAFLLAGCAQDAEVAPIHEGDPWGEEPWLAPVIAPEGPHRVGLNETFLLQATASPNGTVAVYELAVPGAFDGIIEVTPLGDPSLIHTWGLLSVTDDLMLAGILSMPLHLGVRGPGSEVPMEATWDPALVSSGEHERGLVRLALVVAGDEGAIGNFLVRLHTQDSAPEEATNLRLGANLTHAVGPRAIGEGFHFGLYIELLFFFDVIAYTPEYVATREAELPGAVAANRAYTMNLHGAHAMEPAWYRAAGYADGNTGEWELSLGVGDQWHNASSEYIVAPLVGYVDGEPVNYMVAGPGNYSVNYHVQETEVYRAPTVAFASYGFGATPEELFGVRAPAQWSEAQALDLQLPGLTDIPGLMDELKRRIN